MDNGERKTPYLQVAELLMSDARSEGLAVGSRLPSVRELSTRYSVAKATVQQALRQLETEGVLYAIERKGVFLAKKPPEPTPQSTTLGLILNYERYSEETNPFYRSLYEGAEAEAVGRRHNILSLHEWRQKDPIQKSREIAQFRQQLAGFLALAIYDERDCLRLRESGVPTVAVDYETLDLGLDCVVIDNYRVMQDLSAAVAARAAGRIFYADVARASEYDPALVDRRRAFEETLAGSGRQSHADEVILLSGGAGIPTGPGALVAEVEKGGKRPAIICSDESAAWRLIEELGQDGPQPGTDFLLAYLGYLEPQRPEMRELPALVAGIDFGEFGREGVRLLEERIESGPGRAMRRTVGGRLVEWQEGVE